MQASAYRQHQPIRISIYIQGVARTQDGLRFGSFISIGNAKQYKHLSRLHTSIMLVMDAPGHSTCSNTVASRNSHKATKQRLSSAEETPIYLSDIQQPKEEAKRDRNLRRNRSPNGKLFNQKIKQSISRVTRLGSIAFLFLHRANTSWRDSQNTAVA